MELILEKISQKDHRLEPLANTVMSSLKLHELVFSVFSFSMALALILIEDILMVRAKNMDDRCNCPFCSSPLESKGMIDRFMITMIGEIHWKRRVRRCKNGCKTGLIAPFDDELGIKANQRTSFEVKYMGCLLAIFLPYKIAASLLGKLLCVNVSDSAIWNWVQEAGEKAIRNLQTELEQLSKGQGPNPEQLTAEIENLPLVIGGDGVMAPFRPNGGNPEGKTVWKEVKVGIVARVGKRITKTGKQVNVIVRKRVVAVLGTVDEFKPVLWLISVKEGIVQCPTVVWLSDGGKGFWRIFRECYSSFATGILDFYHAVQNVWKGAKVWLDGRTKKALSWFECARKRIRYNRARGVINELRSVLATDQLTEQGQEALEKLTNYLLNHTDHMKYDDYKNLGLPIGSGIVESTCKWLIQQRFKGVGMRWSENGFVLLCSLRVAWVNESFDELFYEDYAPPK